MDQQDRHPQMMNTSPLGESTYRTVVDCSCLLFLWTALYRFLCYVSPSRSLEWHCRVVTCLHAIIATTIAFYCAFVQGPWPFTDAGGTTSASQQFVIKLSLSYFLFDMSWCLYHQTEGALMLVHHCLSIAGLGVTAFVGRWGTEMAAALGGSECTNPLLQLRWFLRETRRHDSVAGDVVDGLFALCFTFVRILVGGYLLYTYLSSQHTEVLGRSGGVCLYALSLVFWLYIMRYMVRKYCFGGRRGRSQPADSSEPSKHHPLRQQQEQPQAALDSECTNGIATTSAAGGGAAGASVEVRLRRCDTSLSSQLVDRI